MCGIVGIFGKDDPEAMAAMLVATRHRGEDETRSASWDSLCGLGINRLSIMDVENGQQPLSDDSGRVHAVCNGEIYNHQSIRAGLATRDKFRSLSDAEVIVHLYREFGSSCLHHLDGMFSIIVYDSVNRTFLAARDRFGIKPLYYVHHDGCFHLASEVKAFLGLGLPDGQIRSLPPGCMLTPAGIRPWFVLDRMRQKTVPNLALLRALLEHAVEKHLMSDKHIRIGVFLSGGIDSSIVTALAARKHPDLVAFTIGLDDSADMKAARQLARHLEIRHVVVPCTFSGIRDLLPQAVYAIESYNPMLVIEGLMTMLLARAAKENGIKVILCGEGSDEIFGGYGVFRDEAPEELDKLMRGALDNIHNTECLRLDRGTMAFSVEARVPFLDPQLVDYAINLPADHLIRETDGRRIEKWILRKSCEDLLPENVVWRIKMPFDHGSGILPIYDEISAMITDDEYVEAQQKFPDAGLNSKATLYLFRLWRERFGPLAGAQAREMFGSYPTLRAAIDRRSALQGGSGERSEDLERLRSAAAGAGLAGAMA